MKSIWKYFITCLCSGILILAGAQAVSAQNDNAEEDRHPDADLHDRMLNLANREYNRALEFGAAAENLQPPENRRSYYEQMLNALESAEEMVDMVESTPEVHQRISDLITRFWAIEHNAAVRILTDDEFRQTVDQPDQTVRIHLENAVMIEPDSIISSETLAYHYLETGDTTSAVTVYEQAMERQETPTADNYSDLIDLYFSQDRFSEAVELATGASEAYPKDETFLQYRVDASLQLEEREATIELLHELIHRLPGNPMYHFTLGTELYHQALEQPDHLREAELTSMTGGDGEGLVREAISELGKAIELDPYNDQIFNTLGIIYQNRAVEFIQIHENTEDIVQAIQYDRKARENLVLAMENIEKAADLNPDSGEYWETLYWIYTRLGMTDRQAEAVEAIKQLQVLP